MFLPEAGTGMVEWTKVETQTPQPVSPSQDSPSETSEPSGERERPIAVTAMAAYQWLKAALFVQLFWNSWSTRSHSSLANAVNMSSWAGQNYAALLLLAVALYLVVLGLGLWNLQKWALLLFLLIWLPDLAYGFRPEAFGLQHTADFWLGGQSFYVFLGITTIDVFAFFPFANRTTFKAFNAEEEAKIFWWVRDIFFWMR